MTSQSVEPRVAAMLAAYESRSIDAEDLYARLLKALNASGSTDHALRDLLDGVDEACDLGRSEREDIAWAAARYWRSRAENS